MRAFLQEGYESPMFLFVSHLLTEKIAKASTELSANLISDSRKSIMTLSYLALPLRKLFI